MTRAGDDDDDPRAGRRPRPRRVPVAAPHAIAGMYTWDERTHEHNRSKHSIAFETAVLAFEDPRQVTSPPETVGGEQRWQTVGMASPGLMLLVVHTRRAADPDRIYLLSARRVTKAERLLYDNVKGGRSKQVLGHPATPADRAWFGAHGFRRRVFGRRRDDAK